MKVLFTSEAVLFDKDGQYYSNNLVPQLARYSYFGDVTCVCYKLDARGQNTMPALIDKTASSFCFTKKENKLSSLLSDVRDNDVIIKNEVIKCDMVIAHVPSSNSNHAIKWAKKYNKPYMLVVVGCPWDSMWNYSWKGKILAPFSFLKLRHQLSESKYALYVTERFLQQRYPCSGLTEYASNVCIQPDSDSVLTNRIKRIENLSESSPINIVTTASVKVRYKGQEYVIRAIGKLCNEFGYNYHYYLIGGGDQQYLKNVARQANVEDRVHFMGRLSHDDVISALDNMDIYIQPSKQEGLPRAMIEGMSRALPAIGTRVAGIPELVDDKYLVRKANVEDIVDVLAIFLDKECMKKQAYVNYVKSMEYTLEKLDARRYAFFDKFIKNNFRS